MILLISRLAGNHHPGGLPRPARIYVHDPCRDPAGIEMFGATSSERPQRIAFILVPNFSMIAFTSAVEPLRLANRTAGKDLYSWRIFSGEGKPVAASNG